MSKIFRMFAIFLISVAVISLLSCNTNNEPVDSSLDDTEIDTETEIKNETETSNETAEVEVSTINKKIKVGDEVVFTISYLPINDVKSCGINLIYDKEVFELVSGSIIFNGDISDFSDGRAVIAFENPKYLSGDVLMFTLRAKKSVEKTNVTCETSIYKSTSEDKIIISNISGTILNIK